MVKQKKKRNKSYKGSGARIDRPTVTRIEAVNRNKLQQWWFEKRRVVKPISIAVAVAVVIIWLLFELFRLFV